MLWPFFCALSGALLLSPLSAEEADSTDGRPLIRRLDTRDVLFRQYQEEVAAGRQLVYSGRGGQEALVGSLSLYVYAASEADELLQLAARCNIPYAGIATVNRLTRLSSLHAKPYLLLPSMPGLFLPETPGSDLERLLLAGRDIEDAPLIACDLPEGRTLFRFLPGADFSPTERAFFLNASRFRFPLKTFTLTSAFGPRVSPISGAVRPHGGLDLAAPEGTEVYAAREGTVSETGNSPVYGNYVIISHSENWTSLYGHLSVISVVKGRDLSAGSLVGLVGSTGQSTGPHLHFELRQNGKPEDPGRYLQR